MPKFSFLLSSIVFVALSGLAAAHPGHDGESENTSTRAEPAQLAAAAATSIVPVLESTVSQGPAETGQRPYSFWVYEEGATLPDSLEQPLRNAHGGFAVDHRPGRGQTYFALPGAGVLRLSADLRRVDLLETAAPMRDTNLHNTTLWLSPDDDPRLSFPANQAEAVYTTDLNADLLHTLGPPAEETIVVPAVREYFDNGGAFVPTDVAYLDGRLYVTTGYSPLDYVLVARLSPQPRVSPDWLGLAFGGKGNAPDQFQTGHGITVAPDRQSLVVADRPTSLLKRFSPEGDYLDRIELPEGAYPCDVDYWREFTLVPCLHGPDRDKGAPIYLLRNGEIVSTIMIKEDLGLPRFQHIHNAVLRELNGRLYIIAQAWNPGDFVILEQAF